MWDNTYLINLTIMIVLQKRAARIIGKTDFNSHINPLFISLNY